jgi:hypothetical protein
MAEQTNGATNDIGEIVEKALDRYEFYRRQEGRVLVRRRKKGGRFDRLIDGVWVQRHRSFFVDSSEWESLDTCTLTFHARRYLIEDLMSGRVTGRHPFRRLRLSLAGRWALPTLKGGASRKIDKSAADCARDSYAESLRNAGEIDCAALREQALAGFEQQRQRGSGAEQKANFFLGAAGLTTTLVLANAGLLVGSDKLHDRWRELAAGALILASICAILCGVRALQAAMATFSRTPPNSVGRLLRRITTDEAEFERCHIAALLVAQGRAGVVADWKISRMASARRWFAGVIAGVVLLTGFVLADAFIDSPPDRVKAKFVSVSVPEVAVLGEDHRHAGGVAGVDHVGVAFGAAGLDHRGGAGLDRQLGAVGEGEEGVGGDGGAG